MVFCYINWVQLQQLLRSTRVLARLARRRPAFGSYGLPTCSMSEDSCELRFGIKLLESGSWPGATACLLTELTGSKLEGLARAQFLGNSEPFVSGWQYGN
jgi:hypothetical protein